MHNPKSEFLISYIINKQSQWIQKKQSHYNNVEHESIVNFAKRIQNVSSTATDIFFFSTRFSPSSSSPTTNTLSEHDAQCVMTNNIAAAGNLTPLSGVQANKRMKHICSFRVL